MINEIKVFNVNFGDCFICSDGAGNKMLVDFGNSRNRFESGVINAVNRELKHSMTNYLMVTHFHDDHINGLAHLDEDIKFSGVYLPNFFSKHVIRLQFAILAFLSVRTTAYKIAYNLLHLLPNISGHIERNTRIEFVARKDRIFNDLDGLRVLWPDFNMFEKKAEKLYGLFTETAESDGEAFEILNRFSDSYFDVLSRNNNSIDEIDARRSVSALNGIINEFDAVYRDRRRQFTARTEIKYDVSRKISSYQNDICLCFDNEPAKDNKVLFLSDISPKYFDVINDKSVERPLRLLDRYKAIKIAHHGTKNYFVKDLPDSDTLIISNGDTGNISWQISALYGYRYCMRRFICTNYCGACEYSLADDTCLSHLINRQTECGENSCLLPRTVFKINLNKI